MTNSADPPASPRLAALQAALAAGEGAALARSCAEVAAVGTPLIEPLPGDDAHALVTFLWRGGDGTRNVVAETPFDGGDPADCQMPRLLGSDVWYRSFRAPRDLRFSYFLAPDDPLTPWSEDVPWVQRVATWRADPRNPGRRP